MTRRAGKRKGRSGKTRARNRAKRRHPLRRLFGRLLLLVLVSGGLYALYLGYQVRRGFEAPSDVQPARVYSRPLEIRAGLAVSQALVASRLEERGYREVAKVSRPGEYAASPGVIDLVARSTTDRKGERQVQAVRLRFGSGAIASITSHRSGQALERVEIEPGLIGNLQLGPHRDQLPLKLHDTPEGLTETLLLMEDRRFASHYGVDPRGILRALWNDLRKGGAVQGGSTLTQQLVKNLYLSPERTVSRKLKEMAMALLLELQYDKPEILERYLNEIFLGQSGYRAIHGFGMASRYYFNRPLQELEPQDFALLVGLIPAPSHYNPRRHPERARKRRNLVIDTMAKEGVIAETRAAEYKQRPLGIAESKPESASDYPAFLDYMHRQLRQYYSEEVLRTDGLQVYTSLDPAVQRATQRALTRTLKQLEQRRKFTPNSLQGAALVVNAASGEVLAMVGDRKPGYAGFNRALDAARPIGSLIKPVVYLAALEDPGRYSLATLLEDTPLTLRIKGAKDWSPRNYDKKFRRRVPLLDALSHSYNVPTVRLGLDVGIDNVIETLNRLGVTRPLKPYPALLLGAGSHPPVEVAQFYQPLANHGVRTPLRTIRAVLDNRDQPVARFPRSERRVVASEHAYLIDFALREVVRDGTARALGQKFDPALGAAGKTGTTDSYRDSWFAGYGGRLLAVVWIGRDDNKPVKLSGASGAMLVWGEIMSALPLQPSPATPPAKIAFATIDTASGLLADENCPDRRRLPFAGGFLPEKYAGCARLTTRAKGWFKGEPKLKQEKSSGAAKKRSNPSRHDPSEYSNR
ncbi:MAG: penicillin-binding protein 1B [Pseudomonadota bacterium]|nr:penicillin-binding protein 1B [Pseudomonadota bacterium]